MFSSQKSIMCRAATMMGYGKPLVVQNVIVDPPGPYQVRIQMVSAGISSSDCDCVWKGNSGHQLPLVLGHEGAGIVESIGPNVDSLHVDDHVLVNMMPSCGECDDCRNPNTNVCAKYNLFSLKNYPNKRLPNGQALYGFCGLGTMSEFVLLRQEQVVKIDKQANLYTACIISSAVFTGFYAATHQAKVTPGSTVAIWGLGAIGLNAVFGSKYCGAVNVIGIDVDDDKRSIAYEFGVTEFINPLRMSQPLNEYLLSKYNGIQFAIECIGNVKTIETALLSLKPYGTLALVGLPPPNYTIPYPMQYMLTGKTIVGALLGSKQPRQGYEKLIKMWLAGGYHIDRLVSHRLCIDQINEGFQVMKLGKCIRAIVTFVR